MDKEKAILLLEKYEQGICTAEERAAVEAWYNTRAAKNNKGEIRDDLDIEKSLIWDAVLANRMQHRKIKLWPRIIGIAAAVIGIAICVWLYYSANTPRNPELVSGTQFANDIAPGGNRATLTSNGNTINLSEAKTGIVVNDDITYNDGTGIAPLSSRAHETSSGQAAAKDLDPSEVGMTKVTTPRGGTYSIILQDGTKVWLNTDSKLEFYSNYRNKLQRIVKMIAGEAYFEVAKNKAKPFIVECNGQRTEVLGTHFNISAYNDDTGIRTTLLEGSVRVSPTPSSRARSLSSRASSLSSRATAKDLDPSELGMTKGSTKGRDDMILKPGQQSLVTENANITIKEVDANEAIAWKDGKFRFYKTPLPDVMKQLARWYDVEVLYPNGIPGQQFTGDLNRNLNASEVLEILKMTRVKFKIEGKKIIVTK